MSANAVERVWTALHTRVAVALGIAWILDGFETTVTGPVLPAVAKDLHLQAATAALVNPVYTAGMLIGALVFGPLADRLGRRRLFLVTLGIYASATVLTGFSWNFASLAFFRLLTGIGIGGEYGAINSAIEEFVPARYRGRVDGTINASWNIGAIVASVAAIAALGLLPAGGWRAVFWFGAIVAIAVLVARRSLPESPRWLVARERVPGGYLAQIAALWKATPARTIFSFVLNLAQVMPYYGILALGGLVIFPAVGLSGKAIPLLYLAAAASGLCGQLVMAVLSDSLGRRPTMFVAFAGAGALCAGLGLAHSPQAFVAAFVAFGTFSAACGAGAYVVIGELFPTELRATGIGLGVAAGRVGAIAAPIGFYALDARFGVDAVFAAMGAIFATGALAMAWWWRYGVEGRGRTLEEMLDAGVR